MSFLQPWMLIVLPLAAIPIIIHLINQRRYQTTQWAAMMFLLSANRMNRGYARIRQWLILAFRALVIAALVIAVGRPLVSGRLGQGMVGSLLGQGTPLAIVLLDRSPSMQQSVEGSAQTKLQIGLEQIASTLDTMGVAQVVLIQSNTVAPLELPSAQELLDLPQVGPSDATADLPGMLLATVDHINANQLGQADVWICSDLRQSDWRADDGRWDALRQAFAEMGRRVRFRLLALPETDRTNLSVQVDQSLSVVQGDQAFASITLAIGQPGANENQTSQTVQKRTIPVTFDVTTFDVATMDLEGTRSTVEVDLQNSAAELAGHRLPLPPEQTRGHGFVSIPADTNTADNQYFFTFDTAPPRRTVVVTDNDEVGRVLRLAAGIASEEQIEQIAEVISPANVGSIRWDEAALVLWQAPLPDASSESSDAVAIESFVDRGGRIIFMPPESVIASTGSMYSMTWQDWQQPESELAVTTWRGDADLLAATLAGTSLPVGKLRVSRFAGLQGDATVLASLGDGAPLLVRVATQNGGVYFLSTTPAGKDSSLAVDGVVLYVLVQRALTEGAKSLGDTRQLVAGQADPIEAAQWRRLSGQTTGQRQTTGLSTENAFLSGVYLRPDDGHLLAVNRSASEDQSAVLSDQKVTELFQGLVFDRIDQQGARAGSLVEEAWRAFLVVMLIAMIGEAVLCLPRHRPDPSSGMARSSGMGGDITA